MFSCYHIYLIPEDVQLKDAIDLAYENGFSITANGREDNPNDDTSVGGPNTESI